MAAPTILKGLFFALCFQHNRTLFPWNNAESVDLSYSVDVQTPGPDFSPIINRGNPINVEYRITTPVIMYYHCLRLRRSLRYTESKKILRLSLLIICGDIAINPGPVRYPCGVCSRAVAKSHRAVFCDGCERWMHIKCADISPAKYQDLCSDPNQWHCVNCLNFQSGKEQNVALDLTINSTVSSLEHQYVDLVDNNASNPKIDATSCDNNIISINDSFCPASDEEEDWLTTTDEQSQDDNSKSSLNSSSGSETLSIFDEGSTFARHETGKDHMFAASARHSVTQNITVQRVVETQRERDCGYTDEALSAQINTMYYVAKEGVAINQYDKVISLQVKNKCPGLQNPKKIYSSEQAKIELLDAIDSTLDEYLTENLQQSDYIGLILDESTDITVHKKLNVYVKCLANNEPKVHFLDCVNVENGTADTIVNAVKELFASKNIPLNKVVTLASDGASVMTGRLNGVGVKLKEHCPMMIQIHCVAHRLALAAGHACRDIEMLDEYQRTVKNVYRHFANSAVRYNKLRTMMDILEDPDHKFVTLKEPASFRWLSLGRAVDAIYEIYPALYQTLEQEATEGLAEAKGLLTKVKSVNFVLVTAFLKDVLSIVNRISTTLQGDNVDIEVVDTQVDVTQAKLGRMKRVNGPELDKTYSSIENGVYRDVKLTDRENLRMGFQKSAGNYLDKLVENISDRFEPESMATLKHLDVVLNPSKIPKAMKALESHGDEDLEKLIEVYGGSVVNADRVRDTYIDMKIILKNLNKNLQDGCVYLIKNYSDLYPDFVQLAKILLVSPVTSVACERGFSVHNHIKTKGRSRLGHATVVKLMRIKQEGPSLADFDPSATLSKFKKMRDRRK